MNTQHQCGMLWGSSLAVGAESCRQFSDHNEAMAMAIIGTQRVVESFVKRANSVNCRDVVGVDIEDKISMAQFMLKSLPGGFNNMVCMNLAESWAPEAIQAAKEGLTNHPDILTEQPLSCASEIAKRMGAGDEEQIMVAGFAGGMGLSGNGCGALAAAIWLSSLKWCRENPGKSGYENPHSAEILRAFNDTTGSEMLCSKISCRRFKTIDEHTQFINEGGCSRLIDTLAIV